MSLQPSSRRSLTTIVGRKRSRGFTLLELMVVMFIMMVMAGLALAAFHAFRDTERLKLAGGQVTSTVSMARQYAMSKRIQCLVEFISPPQPMTTTTTTENPTEVCCIRSYSYDSPGPGMTQLNGGFQRYFMYAKYNLPTLSGGARITRAVLKIRQNGPTSWGPLPVTVTVGGVNNDTWSPASLTWRIVYYNSQYPADGGTLGVISVAAINTDYEVDISSYVKTQSDGKVSVQLTCPDDRGGNDHGLSAVSATLSIDVATPSGPIPEDSPRYIRVIPYMRKIDPATGGFTWILDTDVNALKTMEMPKNVNFALTPATTVVKQYDPVIIPNKYSVVNKVFLLIAPDGSCQSLAPEVPDVPAGNTDHWKGFINAVILRDTTNDRLCIIHVPALTSAIRERYLSETEAAEFKVSHAPYALW